MRLKEKAFRVFSAPAMLLALNSNVSYQAVEVIQPAPVTEPAPPADPYLQTVSAFREDFSARVRRGDTNGFYNKCFTRNGREYQPQNVNAVRALNLQQKIDYSRQLHVVLDAGHGSAAGRGFDTGAIRAGKQEARLIDGIVTPLVKILEEEYGVKVITTRDPVGSGISLNKNFRFPDQDRILQYRSELTKTVAETFPNNPVIFVSVHGNVSLRPLKDKAGNLVIGEDGKPALVDKTDTSGAEIYYYNGGQNYSSSESKALAQSLKRNYSLRSGAPSLIKSEDFAVLRCLPANIPAVLFETGYLTNSKDRRVLSDQPEKLARQIAAGISDYIGDKWKKQFMSQMVMASTDLHRPARNPVSPQ